MSHPTAITFPYRRQIEVAFEGLAGGGSTTMTANGTMTKYHIGVQILKSIQSVGAVSTLWIYNLHPDTRSSLVRSDTKVKIRAGWMGGPQAGMHLVFSGNFLMSQIRREGPDVITTLHVQAGRLAAVTAKISRTWSKGVPLRTVVEDIARNMEGVQVEPELIRGVDGFVGDGGMPICADAETALNKLARQFGFFWSIVDDKFQTVNRDPDKEGGVIANAGAVQSPYLSNVNTVLAGVRRVQRGIEAECLFNPALRPGNGVTILSDVDPRANGPWRVTTVSHSLSTFDGQFSTSFTGLGRRRA